MSVMRIRRNLKTSSSDWAKPFKTENLPNCNSTKFVLPMLMLQHSGPFQWVTLHVLEIKKIYQRIVNNVNLSVLKLEKRYLHQNGVELNQKLIKHTPLMSD